MLTKSTESVAEYTKRPLLSITGIYPKQLQIPAGSDANHFHTAADLGHVPEILEKNLLSFFKNAHEWDAVVLLDEADVYLQRRQANDLVLNSVVASRNSF